MNNGNPMSVDREGEPAEQIQRAHDFSVLQGLQIVGAEPSADSEEANAAWRDALTLELETRAARFHQAVDASIVLANDGVIRWLGDPVAKLARGSDLLSPGAVLLADSRLPDASRETVVARLELWLGALSRRLLGPLFALRELQHDLQPVRDLGEKLTRALGVLERDHVRNQVKALDQDSRAALRKHGVGFGAYYIYVPTALKPAARALALQLWGLQTPGADADALAQGLLPMASSGRTSLPADPRIPRDGYRVAGFRPCGERVVRVDIVERLADMIRAAFVQPTAGRARVTPGGFAVNGQMTSLTGCSGESFFSILRSLGFESFEIKRSELAKAPVPAETGPEASAEASLETSAADAAQEGGPTQADQSAGDAEDAPPEATPAQTDQAGGDAAEAAPEATPAQTDQAAGATADAPPEATPAQTDHAAGEAAPAQTERSADDEEPPKQAADQSLVEAPLPPLEPGAEAAPLTVTGPASSEEPEAPPAPAETAKADASADAEDETVTLWRPARRPRPTRDPRRDRVRTERREAAASAQTPAKELAKEEAPNTARPSFRPKEAIRKRRQFDRDTAGQEAGAASGPVRSESPRPDEKRRDSARNRAMARPKPAAVAQPQPVDPNSPFAKLLELRPLLEMQGKNRT